MITEAWVLRILVEVADRGSLTAAAEALSLSQPAVSRSIARLERRFGVSLFNRHPRGVELTPSGVVAVARAREVLDAIARFDDSLSADADGSHGELRICAFPSANTVAVPRAVQEFKSDHPSVHVRLVNTDAREALEAVAHGDIDLAVLTSWQLFADPEEARLETTSARTHAATSQVQMHPLGKEEFLVALPEHHPLAGRSTVRLAQLAEASWIDGGFPDCLGPLQSLTDALGRPPRVDFHCDDWNGKCALVAAGAGVMLVPALARHVIHPGIALRRTSPSIPPRRLLAATRRSPFRNVAAERMLAFVEGAVTATLADPRRTSE